MTLQSCNFLWLTLARPIKSRPYMENKSLLPCTKAASLQLDTTYMLSNHVLDTYIKLSSAYPFVMKKDVKLYKMGRIIYFCSETPLKYYILAKEFNYVVLHCYTRWLNSIKIIISNAYASILIRVTKQNFLFIVGTSC